VTPRPPSPRATIFWSTAVALVLGAALLTTYYRDLATYRDGTAPERDGVVVSAPTHRHMTCGRSEDGYQVQVRYAVGTAERVEPLETCDPSDLREGTSVRVWERRSDLLTSAPPGPESQVLPIALTIIVAAWALVVGLSLRRLWRTA
jgi:hypothetical protein